MIVCAGNNETFSFASTIGVGLIESAMNLTRICLFDKPDYIIFIGSAGSYGDHKIFDIVESSNASNLELSFLDNNKKYMAHIYADGQKANWKTNPQAIEIKQKEVTSKTILNLKLAPGGGQAIKFSPI